LENSEYLTLAEFLLVAEVATGVPAETLSRLPRKRRCTNQIL
jgi:hypothetical protein